jgi:N-acetylmuramic acid 6-phosphate (MurNAc-6-P) etherase
MDQQKKVAHDLKDVLRAIESAKNAVASELSKGGNLPYAYSQLQAAQQKLTRALRDLG